MVIGEQTEIVCGTSCSSPSVAGMASLINAIRIEAGASSVGFINPALYQNYSTSGMFNDITSGWCFAYFLRISTCHCLRA